MRTVILSSVVTSGVTQKVLRTLAEGRRRVTRRPHEVLYFHQVDDPYSHLVATHLSQLAQLYDVRWVPLLVGPPPDWAAPDRERLVGFSRRDAQDIAGRYKARFVDPLKQPPASMVEMANRALAKVKDDPEAFMALAPQVGEALWGGDEAVLRRLALDSPPVTLAREWMADNAQRREKLGHYLGATFYYGSEWYWGLDRLHYLEQRLHDMGLWRGVGAWAPIVSPPVESDKVSQAPPGSKLEFFFSLRSPYSYLALARTFALARRRGVELVPRPVLPMVMRGLQVPFAKRIYIVRDTAREAKRQGIPFGRIADPVGTGIERGLAVAHLAQQRGVLEPFFINMARGVMAEGRDITRDKTLASMAQHAGMDWSDAQKALGDDAWRQEADANRQALLELGLWGVPSFRFGQTSTWGQDRLWLIEDAIEAATEAHRATSVE